MGSRVNAGPALGPQRSPPRRGRQLGGHWVFTPLAFWAEKGTRGALNLERALSGGGGLPDLLTYFPPAPLFSLSLPSCFPHQLPLFCLLFPTL